MVTLLHKYEFIVFLLQQSRLGVQCNVDILIIIIMIYNNDLFRLPAVAGLTHTVYTPCPGKKEASSFSTISFVFLDRFS